MVVPVPVIDDAHRRRNAEYLSRRLDLGNSFGYGLARRTHQALTALEHHAPRDRALDVVDFGCADGSMLRAAREHLGSRFAMGLGLDVFRSGQPEDEQGIAFRTADLFRQYPYPIADAAFDVAIASAFVKHHPEPARFLGEVSRCLRPGGIAVLLDPRPAVVRIGARLGRFNPAYNPSLWSDRSMRALLATNPSLGLRVAGYDRYWLAPTHALYRLGLERWVPKALARHVSLHQCLVLARHPE